MYVYLYPVGIEKNPQKQLLPSRANPDKKAAVLNLPSSHDGHQGSDSAGQPFDQARVYIRH